LNRAVSGLCETWLREFQMVHLTGEEMPSEVAEQVILTARNRPITGSG